MHRLSNWPAIAEHVTFDFQSLQIHGNGRSEWRTFTEGLLCEGLWWKLFIKKRSNFLEIRKRFEGESIGMSMACRLVCRLVCRLACRLACRLGTSSADHYQSGGQVQRSPTKKSRCSPGRQRKWELLSRLKNRKLQKVTESNSKPNGLAFEFNRCL